MGVLALVTWVQTGVSQGTAARIDDTEPGWPTRAGLEG